MIISLVRMPVDGLKFEHQYQDNELDASDFEFKLKRPPFAAGRVDRVGLDMRLRGTIKASLIAPCDRCLADVQIEVEIPFDLLYAPGNLGGGAGETELQARDLEIAVYQNDSIDLDQLTLEQLELSLPSRVLCREECRGLCPQCGADLNIEQCQCRKQIDPRWQALADLKENLDNN